MRVVFLHPYTKFEVRKPCRSEDMAHDVCDLVSSILARIRSYGTPNFEKTSKIRQIPPSPPQ